LSIGYPSKNANYLHGTGEKVGSFGYDVTLAYIQVLKSTCLCFRK
jgi:hypothetical protein